MRLLQFVDGGGERRVGLSAEDGQGVEIIDAASVYELALACARGRHRLADAVSARRTGRRVELAGLVQDKALLLPVDHPDPARCMISGTGLSHLGSAAARDAMHAKIAGDEQQLTDSMKMFKWGIEGGKPPAGSIGVQPEWFYKGDGRCAVAPEQGLELPGYALDGGDEVEVVGIYLIDEDGAVCRLGYALGNEYADHVMERQNYLYLAHSKLRQCSYGPELLLGELPQHVAGRARLLRGTQELWADDFLSGDDNMAHSIANLEHHHFKYADFRRPGDLHVHYFGAATGSFTKNVKAQPGDVFEIASPQFGLPLRNTLIRGEAASDQPLPIRTL